MPKKVWISGFEGLYKISEEGKIFTYKVGKGSLPVGSELKISKNAKGYSQVRIYDSEGKGVSVRIHKLVANAFIKNPNKFPQIDHIDGDKDNNSAYNLRWVTNQTNSEKALAKVHYLLHKDGTGLFIYNFSKWCRSLNLNVQTFYKMKNKQRKSAYGYTYMEVYYS